MLARLAKISRPFLDQVSDRDVAALKQAAISMRYQAGELIHNRGDNKPGLSIVKSGLVRVGLIHTDGTFVIMSMLGAGQTFGEFTLFADLPRTHDIIAQNETLVWQLPGNRFLQLCENCPALLPALLKTSLVRNFALLEMIEAMRSLPVLERVAKMLVILVATARQGENFYTRHSDLSATLGVSRATLSKALSKLEELSFIERGYGRINISDHEALTNWVLSRELM